MNELAYVLAIAGLVLAFALSKVITAPVIAAIAMAVAIREIGDNRRKENS